MPSGAKKRKKVAAAAAKRKEEEEMGIFHPPPPLSPTNPLPSQQELEEKGEMESSDNSREENPSSELPVTEVKDVNIEFAQPMGEEPSISERSPGILPEKVGAREAALNVKDEVGGSSLGGETSVSERPTEILLEKVEASEPTVGVKDEVDCSSLGREVSVSERSTEILLEKVGEEASGASLTEEKVEASEAAAETSVEAKEGVGGHNLGGETSITETCTEIILKKVPSIEEPVAPVTEEVVEASEVPISVPADSALSEGEESREMPHMGTIIEGSAIAAPAPAPLLEHRASLWNCCGLLDVFKSS